MGIISYLKKKLSDSEEERWQLIYRKHDSTRRPLGRAHTVDTGITTRWSDDDDDDDDDDPNQDPDCDSCQNFFLVPKAIGQLLFYDSLIWINKDQDTD